MRRSVKHSPGADRSCGMITELVNSRDKKSHPVLVIDATLAFNCLRSTPINGTLAVAFIEEIKKYLAFEANLAYIKEPPPSYWAPPVDLLGELDLLGKQAVEGAFDSQYDFDQAFYSIIFSAHEPHLIIHACTGVAISFVRPVLIVSASEDGFQPPGAYVLGDLMADRKSYSGSQIVYINGQITSNFLEKEAALQPWDPDSSYNNLFWSASRPPSAGMFSAQFTYPIVNTYPGSETILSFANRSTVTIKNMALIQTSNWLESIKDGETFFSSFCSVSTLLDQRILKSAAQNVVESHHAVRDLYHVPTYNSSYQGSLEPVIREPNGMQTGYFLDSPEYKNVAVLWIGTFWPLGDLFGDEVSDQWRVTFMNTTRDFLRMAKETNKTRLILDVSGNMGGDVALAAELLKLLFPRTQPWQYERLRTPPVAQLVASTLINLTANDILMLEVPEEKRKELQSVLLDSIWNPRRYRTANGEVVTNLKQFLLQTKHHNDDFSAVLKDGTSIHIDDYGPMVASDVMSSDEETSQDFNFHPESIILLTDGTCSSACSFFVESLRYQQRIKSIAFGGLPHQRSMQAVGGTRGANATPLSTLQKLSQTLMENSLVDESQVYFAKEVLPGLIDLPLGGDWLLSKAQLNTQDYILPSHINDPNQIPQHYYWEPAECHAYFTTDSVVNSKSLWEQAAGLAWSDRLCAWGNMSRRIDLELDLRRDEWNMLFAVKPEIQNKSALKFNLTQVSISTLALAVVTVLMSLLFLTWLLTRFYLRWTKSQRGRYRKITSDENYS